MTRGDQLFFLRGVLPLAIFVLLLVWLGPGDSTALEETQRKLDLSRKRLQAIGGEHSEVIQDLKRQNQDIDLKWKQVTRNKIGDAASLRTLSEMIKRYNMVLINEEPLDREINKEDSQGLRHLATQLRQRQGHAGEVWRFRCDGTWSEMLRMLEDLAEEPGFSIPVGLEMEPSQDDQYHHRWTLLVWI